VALNLPLPLWQTMIKTKQASLLLNNFAYLNWRQAETIGRVRWHYGTDFVHYRPLLDESDGVMEQTMYTIGLYWMSQMALWNSPCTL
jgi:hypothetical protein